jgi:hypothetical protein
MIRNRALTLILWLAFFAACFLPASALTLTAPENRVWEIFSTGYDTAIAEVTDLGSRTETSTSDYDTAPIHHVIIEELSTGANRSLIGQNAEFEAAEGGGSALDAYLSGSGGRLGGTATRQLNDALATSLEDSGLEVTGGAGRGPEEFIPGAGPGSKGGTYVDITATDGTTTTRVQTIDTLSDGITPTPREAAAAARIQAKYPNDVLILIPK